MQEYTKYFIVYVILICLEAVWFGSKLKFYYNYISNIRKSGMKYSYYLTFIAYFIMIFSTAYASIKYTMYHIDKEDGGLENADMYQKFWKSLVYGGTMGFVIYDLYNLTSLSINNSADLKVAIFDVLWGTCVNTLIVFIFTML